jgi:hypothetical protein
MDIGDSRRGGSGHGKRDRGEPEDRPDLPDTNADSYGYGHRDSHGDSHT